MADFKDILFGDEDQPNNEDFLHFHGDDLLKNENLMDEKTAEALFEQDASEGLKKINSSKRVKSHVTQLNKKLQQQLASQKKRLPRKDTKELTWIILTLLILLSICVIGYIVIRIQKPAASIHHTKATINKKTSFFQM